MQLTHHHGARFAQLANRGRVAHTFGELPNARRRTVDIQLVFHGDWDAVHRTAPIALLNFLFGRARFSHRRCRPLD